MEFAIGIAAATAVGLFATVIGFDKERSFYPVVLIVIATLYLLFAAMAGSTDALVAEAIPALVFVATAALGFRKDSLARGRRPGTSRSFRLLSSRRNRQPRRPGMVAGLVSVQSAVELEGGLTEALIKDAFGERASSLT